MEKQRILILGAAGMLGHALYEHLSQIDQYEVFGTIRHSSLGGLKEFLPNENHIRKNVDGDNFDSIVRALASIQPKVVINCIGLIKQLPLASDPLSAISINAQLPHRISLVCRTAGARMIHISTDCVFDGEQGNYLETDPATAKDLYGMTKYLGEVLYPHCVTLRTSIIGHELKGNLGLIDWFIGQSGRVNGFTQAIYSGFPTVELARIISSIILPNPQLHGLYHVASAPISKFELLKLVAQIYGKTIELVPMADFRQNRALNGDKFRMETGYIPPSWPDLVQQMHKHYRTHRAYRTVA